MKTDLHYMGRWDTLWAPVIYDLCTQLLQWTRPSSVAAGKRLMKTDLHYMGEAWFTGGAEYTSHRWAHRVIYDSPMCGGLSSQLLQWTRPSSVAAGKRLMNTDLHYMGEIDTLWAPVIYDLCTQLLQWTRPSSVAAGKRLMNTDLHYMGEIDTLWAPCSGGLCSLVSSLQPLRKAWFTGGAEYTSHRSWSS